MVEVVHPPARGPPQHPNAERTAEGACVAAENWSPEGVRLVCSSLRLYLAPEPLHAVVPDMNLVCMTVFLRAAPTRSNAKHADKGKGSDLEMTNWSKARSEDEVAEEKPLQGYIDKAC